MTGLEALRDRPLVFVADLERPELSAGDRNHLERSLRIRPGSPITVADGAGRWRAAILGPEVHCQGPVVTEARPAPPITIGFAPVKGDRSDLVVQKLTELGVDDIVPLLTERSVVRWDEARAAKNLTRHLRIVREAAMQSRNPWLPTVRPLCPLASFVAGGPSCGDANSAGGGEAVLLADPAGTPFDDAAWNGEALRIAIGPEGGFSPEERHGHRLVALPGRILRTETAAITAAVLTANARRG